MDLKRYIMLHSQALLAKDLGVDRSLVSQWLSGKTRITAERAVQIERTTNGAIRREDLRPDIFGPLCGADASGRDLIKEKAAFASQEERHG